MLSDSYAEALEYSEQALIGCSHSMGPDRSFDCKRKRPDAAAAD